MAEKSRENLSVTDRQTDWQIEGKQIRSPTRSLLQACKGPNEHLNENCVVSRHIFKLEWGCPNRTKYPRGNQFKLPKLCARNYFT